MLLNLQTHAIALILVAGLASSAEAGGLQQFGGWEGDTRGQGYGFLGAGTSLFAGQHVSIPFSASASYLYYAYDSSAARVAVRSPGASVITGIRIASARASASVLGGGEVRQEWREIGPGGSVSQRQIFGTVVQTYDDLYLGRRWYASVFGVYVRAANYLVGHAALRCQLTNVDRRRPVSCHVGIEVVRQGNDVSDVVQGGGFLEWYFAPQRLSLGLHSGYKESWSPGYRHQPGSYFGVSIFRS